MIPFIGETPSAKSASHRLCDSFQPLQETGERRQGVVLHDERNAVGTRGEAIRSQLTSPCVEHQWKSRLPQEREAVELDDQAIVPDRGAALGQHDVPVADTNDRL